MLFVNTAHQCSCWWQDLVDENEDGFLWGELDTLPDDVNKLADSKIRRYQVLLLVDGRNIRLLDLFADYLQGKKFSQ